jgi:quinol monooxygenase YgiN
VHLAFLPTSKYTRRWLSLALALLLQIAPAFATEINAGSETALIFIEVRVEMRGHAGNALRKLADLASEHEASSGAILVMQEIGRPERFAVLRRNAAGLTTTDGKEGPHALTKDLIDDLIAPPDQRFEREFDATSTPAGRGIDPRANLYVIASLDVVPSNLTQIELALHRLAAAARQSDGNLGVEILSQVSHPNHFTFVSAWLGESPFHAFAETIETRAFRQTIAPVLGSPYDERLFRRVD